MALLPPSFLSSSPATVRSAWTGAVKETSAGLVRPAAQRGHGPARLDGTRTRATVADKVMESGKTAGHGNGLPHTPTARQAKRAGPKLEAGPEASAERSEGTMEARQGRNPAGGSMRSTTARPAISHLPGGRGRPGFNAEEATRSGRAHARHRGPDTVAVWPIRRSRVGRVQGRQACAAGIARRAFPWRQAKRAAPRPGRVGITPRRQDAGWIPQPESKAMTSPAGSAHRGHTCPKVRWAGRTR